MPQLDPVTYFSQFFWLCFFFFSFYIVICKDFLPKMGRILKLRKKKINVSAQGVQNMEQENEKVNASSKAVVDNGINTCSQLLSTQLHRVESWLADVVTDVNRKQLHSSNQLYIQWIGDNCIGQQIALQAAGPTASPRVFASILVEKCKNKHQVSKQSAPGWEVSSRSESLDQPLIEKTKRSPQGSAEVGRKSRSSKR